MSLLARQLLLFETFQRTDASPGRHSETTYEFVNRSARPNVLPVRFILETWFASYPRSEQEALKSRFIADFHGAFFELFLFSYFSRDGYKITLHPEVPNSTRTPDFLMEKADCRFYLEATVAGDVSDTEARRRNVEALLLDAINDTPSPNFFLQLREFTIAKGKQPIARRITAFLKRELAKIDPDSIDLTAVERPLDEGPSLQYQDEALSATIGLIPRSLAARGRTDIRPIGIYPAKTRWGGSDYLVRDAVNSKATRYGAVNLPYIIALNCVSEWGVDDDDILNALFGTEQLTFVSGSNNPKPTLNRSGAFIGPDGPWNTRVSGVVLACLYPWNLGAARFELYYNPWAANPITDCRFKFRRATLIDGALRWTGDNDLLGHFGLPLRWPDQPAT